MENWKRAKEMHRLTNAPPPPHPARGVAAPGNGLKAGGNRGPTSVVTVAHVAQVLPLLPADGSCRAPLPHTRSPRGGCVQGPGGDQTGQPSGTRNPGCGTGLRPPPRDHAQYTQACTDPNTCMSTHVGRLGGCWVSDGLPLGSGPRSPGMDSRVRLPAGSGSAAPSDLPFSRSLAPILSNK